MKWKTRFRSVYDSYRRNVLPVLAGLFFLMLVAGVYTQVKCGFGLSESLSVMLLLLCIDRLAYGEFRYRDLQRAPALRAASVKRMVSCLVVLVVVAAAVATAVVLLPWFHLATPFTDFITLMSVAVLASDMWLESHRN